MHLVYEGKVKLDDKVTKYLPEFGKNGKEDVNNWSITQSYIWAATMESKFIYIQTIDKIH